MLLVLVFFYLLDYSIIFVSQNSIYFFSVFILLFILKLATYTVDYDNYHEESIEWVYSFVIISKLKYFHCLYLRNIHKKLHYWYLFAKPWIKLCIIEFKYILSIVYTVISFYFPIDTNYVLRGVNSIFEYYYDEYETPMLKNVYTGIL